MVADFEAANRQCRWRWWCEGAWGAVVEEVVEKKEPGAGKRRRFPQSEHLH